MKSPSHESPENPLVSWLSTRAVCKIMKVVSENWNGKMNTLSLYFPSQFFRENSVELFKAIY